ncbi:MAG: EAL domain-containing protein [Pseudomonadota bacterium]
MGFQFRLLALILPLLMVVQGLSLFVMRDAVKHQITRQSHTALDKVSQSFDRWLDATIKRTAENSSILAADYGFRNAVASGDRVTIESAVENARRRIGADVALVLDTKGEIVASVEVEATAASQAVETLFDEARRTGRATSIVTFDERLVQLVIIPMRAPDIVAWIAFGAEIGEATITRLEQQSSMAVDVSFAVHDGSLWKLAGTSDIDDGGLLSTVINSNDDLCLSSSVGGAHKSYNVANENVSLSTVALRVPGQSRGACMIVKRSLDAALTDWEKLFSLLSMIGITGFMIGGAAVVVFARSLSKPIKALDLASAEMRSGRFPNEILFKGPREIVSLSRTFNLMINGIREREDKIFRHANFDRVTKMPNRFRFEQLLIDAIGRNEALSIIVVEISNFSDICNTLGYQLADEIIEKCATRVGNCVKEEDLFARIEENEFALLLKTNSADTCENIAGRIAYVLDHPISVDGINIDVLIRTGVAQFPDHGNEYIQLLRRAQIAVKTPTEANSSISFYRTDTDPFQPERLSILSELRDAMTDGSLTLHYQPKVDSCRQGVFNAEALLRWVSPTRGFVPPDEFIPIAEETGFVTQLSKWVLAQACADCQQWLERGFDISVSVNLSVKDLGDPTLPEKIQTLMGTHQLPPSAISLEVTEGSVMENVEGAMRALDSLVDNGIAISIDDFGTGHSSMAYVGDLPAKELKIDKCFVQDLATNRKHQMIVRTAIQLGKSFGMNICAEGVEEEEAVKILGAMGCDFLQGWYYSKALPADDFAKLLEERNFAGAYEECEIETAVAS